MVTWDITQKAERRAFPGGPLVKNQPFSAGEVVGLGDCDPVCHKATKFMLQLLSPSALVREKPVHCNERASMPQIRPKAAK